MTIASFLPRQFEINVVGNTIKVYNFTGMDESKSIFFDSLDDKYNELNNFTHLKKVGRLNEPFVIGVNKCNAQFTDIYFGPVKEERKVHEMEKSIELKEDHDEENGQMSNSQLTSAKAKFKQKLYDNANT